ncbi:MAG: hypothetical protein IT480_06420 [Gammaproteobacteria bacterium]|nr:hypothetical protein [Gammaproteobacteria bacterium]
MTEFFRDLGRHDADIDALKNDVRDVKKSLARIEATLHETKGGVRMLITVGSLGGAIGAAVMKAIGMLKGTG